MAERPDRETDVRRHGGALRMPESGYGPPIVGAFDVVAAFEDRVAAFAGAPYAVAVDSCTAALLLCCEYLRAGEVTIPARTYCSVPMAIIHAGGTVRFEDREWSGAYQLRPLNLWDCAKRFRRNLFAELPHPHRGHLYATLSFHQRKLIGIGRGGMILTDDADAARWFQMAKRDGRSDMGGGAWAEIVGRNCYLTPDQAARGLMLMDAMPRAGFPEDQDEPGGYPDLREMPAFADVVRKGAG